MGLGPDRLPLKDEREPLRKDLFDLILLTAHLRSEQAIVWAPNPVNTPRVVLAALTEGQTANRTPGPKRTLDLLNQAVELQSPSRGWHRFCASRTAGSATKRRRTTRDSGPRTRTLLQRRSTIFSSATRIAISPPGEPRAIPENGASRADPKTMEKAIDEYRRALAIEPDHYWSLYQLGRCYVSLGRNAEAVEVLGTCVALKPKSPWAYSTRGIALAAQKRFQDAENELDRAVRLDPEFRVARLNRGERCSFSRASTTRPSKNWKRCCSRLRRSN